MFWNAWKWIRCKIYLTDPASKKAKPHCMRKTMHPITIRKKASTLALTEAKSSSSHASKATAMMATLDSWRRSIYVKLLRYSFILGLEDVKKLNYELCIDTTINTFTTLQLRVLWFSYLWFYLCRSKTTFTLNKNFFNVNWYVVGFS